MQIAVVSADFTSVTGPAGKARRYLIFDAEPNAAPRLQQQLELPEDAPTHHDLHEDDQAPHPVDGMVLITSEAGEGFSERLARRGTQVLITSETDPKTAVALWLDGRLPTLAPTPKEKTGCTAGAKDGSSVA
ncbi:MAG TPA: nitrogen fixation protein [Chromatiaceae bacterium]|jgi:predicted Fe-Mo cluster-binding NifX family protein|nr:MAG: hypothetical protein N838_27835 [Thiohalocapsa sp. PB-PSB1]QQO55229.1 MAG: nitrogen fixation protein [Thiohalocapsa sp. PB-PSB1]HBG95695.1 nitrogen fixation protein [Chromatiaceae bacterium]HCS92826.1 nitrogen fixation protein [Chromatiaceae bacterium]